jgi:hypothetical protein
MVTAMDLVSELRPSALTPADDYIVKPFPFEDLIYRIVAMIGLDRSARSELVERALDLPCYARHHPITGALCLHELAVELPIRSARPGWAALEVSLANTSELIRAYGRPAVEGIASQLSEGIRRIAGPKLLVGHTSLDLAMTILGPASMINLVEQRLHEHSASLARPRASQPNALAPQIALRRADDSAGLCLSLLELRDAMR